MGVFDDKKFEQLDWMSQITETIESPLNGLLARLPDRVEFDVNSIRERASSSRFALQVSSVVHNLMSKTSPKVYLSWGEQGKLDKCFKFEASPDLEVDLAAGTMKGSLALVKIVNQLTDEELQPMMGARGIDAIRSVHWDDKPPFERMNEILDILGKCEEVQKNRSARKKLDRIEERLQDIFANNEWRIRDMSLADKVGNWIANYISTGNLMSLVNFTKLKVMTHNNMPIYSIEEEK